MGTRIGHKALEIGGTDENMVNSHIEGEHSEPPHLQCVIDEVTS